MRVQGAGIMGGVWISSWCLKMFGKVVMWLSSSVSGPLFSSSEILCSSEFVRGSLFSSLPLARLGLASVLGSIKL
ncbi:hypothetical protein EV426DRAFT_599311, partial [Tirmania nivea]